MLVLPHSKNRNKPHSLKRTRAFFASHLKAILLVIYEVLLYLVGFPMAQMVKRLPAMWEIQVLSLEKEVTTHSSTLAWKIPWTEEPGRLQSMGSQRVWHDWATSLSLSLYLVTATFYHFITLSVCTGSFQFFKTHQLRGWDNLRDWHWHTIPSSLWGLLGCDGVGWERGWRGRGYMYIYSWFHTVVQQK